MGFGGVCHLAIWRRKFLLSTVLCGVMIRNVDGFAIWLDERRDVAGRVPSFSGAICRALEGTITVDVQVVYVYQTIRPPTNVPLPASVEFVIFGPISNRYPNDTEL